MKHFLTLLLIVVPFLMFSQEKEETHFKKSKLSGLKSLYEFVGELPADAKIISFEMSTTIDSKSNTIAGNGAEMDDKKTNFFKNVKAGSLVYIDLKHKDNSGKITSMSYKIKIVN